MNEAALSGKRAPQKQEAGDGREFEDTFKPKKNKISVGAAKNATAKSDKKRKAKSPLKAIIICLALLVLLGGAGAALYFTGYLTPVLEFVGLAQPAADGGATLEDREALLAIREKALDDREKSINKREEQLAAKEAQQATEADGQETDQTFGEMLKSLSDEELNDLKRVSSIYSKMDPGEAAQIMGSMYDLMQISSIVYYMQPSASALVLQQMEAGVAADVTELMLS